MHRIPTIGRSPTKKLRLKAQILLTSSIFCVNFYMLQLLEVLQKLQAKYQQTKFQTCSMDWENIQLHHHFMKIVGFLFLQIVEHAVQYTTQRISNFYSLCISFHCTKPVGKQIQIYFKLQHGLRKHITASLFCEEYWAPLLQDATANKTRIATYLQLWHRCDLHCHLSDSIIIATRFQISMQHRLNQHLDAISCC